MLAAWNINIWYSVIWLLVAHRLASLIEVFLEILTLTASIVQDWIRQEQWHSSVSNLSQTVIEQGGLQPGGLNFDAKVRRESTDLEDLFIAHIGAMDAFARGLRNAVRIIEDGIISAMVKVCVQLLVNSSLHLNNIFLYVYVVMFSLLINRSDTQASVMGLDRKWRMVLPH